jgi:glucuronate isomerase
MMSTIFHDNFMLPSPLAQRLYHDYAAALPIIDYHNHLSPEALANNQGYDNLTQLWLQGDHYKWRAMRAFGIDEELITGSADDWSKFAAWSRCVPATLRNPLFHWTQLELKNTFGIDRYLNEQTAAGIYAEANEKLQQAAYRTRGLVARYRAEVVCTTDDPCDDLSHHRRLQEMAMQAAGAGQAAASAAPAGQAAASAAPAGQTAAAAAPAGQAAAAAAPAGQTTASAAPAGQAAASAAPAGQAAALAVLPTFRPDRLLQTADPAALLAYIRRLAAAAGTAIDTFDDLLAALEERVDYFHAHGCRLADHGLQAMPAPAAMSAQQQQAFRLFLQGDLQQAAAFADSFPAAVLLALCSMYHRRGWVQQFHLGPLRNTNSRLRQRLGADAGADSLGDFPQAVTLAAFLDALDAEGRLARTILYNLNPADNEVFAAMCGNFQGDGIRGKMQYGPAWWFLDQADGMEKQLNTLSNFGLLSTFVGMTTDSRSFLSFSRHEYFRRLLCAMLARDAGHGLLPADERWLGGLVADLSYYNAKNYFSLNKQ